MRDQILTYRILIWKKANSTTILHKLTDITNNKQIIHCNVFWNIKYMTTMEVSLMLLLLFYNYFLCFLLYYAVNYIQYWIIKNYLHFTVAILSFLSHKLQLFYKINNLSGCISIFLSLQINEANSNKNFIQNNSKKKQFKKS